MVKKSSSSVTVRAEFGRLKSLISAMPEKVVAKAFAHSLNRAATAGKTATFRMIGQQLFVRPQKEITKRVGIIRARPNGALSGMGAGLAFSALAIPLRFFGPRQSKKGVSVKVKDKRMLIRHAFLSPKSGDVLIRSTLRDGSKKISLKSGLRDIQATKLYSTNVAEFVTNTSVNQAIKTRLVEIFKKNFEHDLKFYMQAAIDKAKGK